ncbi:putative High mobility group protein 1 [Glarea lozoyensis 74030]|nr:putative High mobility group protein 1 [Glarea lozoyensis 74030]
MAKAKKSAEKVVSDQLTIDVNAYIRTRDSPKLDIHKDFLLEQSLILGKVVTGLATLQDAIQTLSSAYIKHTNAILGDHAGQAEIDSSLSKLGDNPALLGDLQRAPSPATKLLAPASVDAAADKKERKKRMHDPNAPKRPLTPFFLYMQTARPIISNDLGPDFAKGAVSTEGTRRWGTMDADDKQLWTNAYKDNLRLYNARMHSYRAGNLAAKDMTDQEAATYAELHEVGADTTADAQLVGEASATALHDEDAEGEPEKEPTPPPVALPKTPKAKPTRKGKATKETPAAAGSDAIVPPSSIVPAKAAAPEEKSPDKKRKRATKKSTEVAEEQVETPKSQPKNSRKKKAKADA